MPIEHRIGPNIGKVGNDEITVIECNCGSKITCLLDVNPCKVCKTHYNNSGKKIIIDADLAKSLEVPDIANRYPKRASAGRPKGSTKYDPSRAVNKSFSVIIYKDQEDLFKYDFGGSKGLRKILDEIKKYGKSEARHKMECYERILEQIIEESSENGIVSMAQVALSNFKEEY